MAVDESGQEENNSMAAHMSDDGDGAAEIMAEVNDLNRQLEEVNAGTHVDVADRIRAIQGIKRRRGEVATAYNNRLLQNARELADFERRSAHATLETALESAKEALLDTVVQEVRRCEEEVRKLFGPGEKALLPPAPPILHPVNKRSRRPKSRALTAAATAREGAAASPAAGTARVPPGAAAATGASATAAAAQVQAAEARAAAAQRPSVLPETVCLTLTDVEMRSDFAAIVWDWRARAEAYIHASGDAQWIAVDAARDARGQPAVRVDGTLFKVADRVVVHSRVTDEEFRGDITAVVGDAVFVRLHGNIPTRLHVDHLASGRLKLRKVTR